MKRFISILAFLVLSGSLLAGTPDTAAQRKAKALDGPGGIFEACNWGILAVNAKGDTIAKLNHKRRMVPASNMKLITTGAALLKLGGGYTFRTRIATDGEIRDSVLFGNLYIIGEGDPMLGELFSYLPKPDRTFEQWGKIISDAGIKRIGGAIVGDGTHFAEEPYHEDWTREDFESKDGVMPSGLCWRGRMDDSIPDGPLAAAIHFDEWLQSHGVTVLGMPCAGSIPEEYLTELGRTFSPPLRSIVSITNHRSDNYSAELLLRELSLQTTGYDDYKHAIPALHNALSPLGLASESRKMHFVDGSGLSRKNYISPDFMVKYLRAMARTGVYTDFHNSLPNPGRADGTLKPRLPEAGPATKNRIFMKSGSMNGIYCFSGYIDAPSGKARETVIFSVMVNNYVGPTNDMLRALDEVIAILADYNASM